MDTSDHSAEPHPHEGAIDALLPPAMAAKAARIGVDKTRLEAPRLLVLAALAGAFIGFGGMLSLVAGTGAEALPWGVGRLVVGIAFSLGLILVVVGGAELFTGNNLMVMAWASGLVPARAVLRAWTLVYVGNLAGALATAALVFLAGDQGHAGGAVGRLALEVGQAKAALPFGVAVLHGVLGNVLVCLAVWLTYGARTTTDRILAIVPPVTAFVALGYEHSVANMFLLPFAWAVRAFAPDTFWAAIGRGAADFPALDAAGIVHNLAAVTLGNLIGGGLLVGAVYWFVYLRGRPPPAALD
jgi:formate/nitrite transporter